MISPSSQLQQRTDAIVLDRISRAQAGDLLAVRRSDRVEDRSWLLAKLPHRMGERVARTVPRGAVALVLGRHPDEGLRDYLLVLCDDFVGWLPPDQVGGFLPPEGADPPSANSGPLG